MKRAMNVLATLAFLGLVACVPSCNTAKGFGEDIEKAGSSIKNSADRHGAD